MQGSMRKEGGESHSGYEQQWQIADLGQAIQCLGLRNHGLIRLGLRIWFGGHLLRQGGVDGGKFPLQPFHLRSTYQASGLLPV